MVKKYKSLFIQLTIFISVVAVYWWVIKGTDFSIPMFFNGFPFMVDFLRRMFPPDPAILGKTIKAAAETVQIAILGTSLAVFFAFPVGFLAAENMTHKPIIYAIFRTVANICRGVSELVWALLFVSMVGLGPFPGVLALMIHSIGALSKFFSEALENIQTETILSLRATGASRIQVIFQGIIPEVLPHFITYVIYYLEHNIRAATVLGIVGAGGIGFELLTSIKLFKYREVLVIILVMLVLVTIVDQLSSLLRKKIIGEQK